MRYCALVVVRGHRRNSNSEPDRLVTQMPAAIIAPSVLASDFGQLTAECKRMIVGGAQWLHMGNSSTLHMAFPILPAYRCYGWVIYNPPLPPPSLTLRFTVILFLILQWVFIDSCTKYLSNRSPSKHRRTHPFMCT